MKSLRTSLVVAGAILALCSSMDVHAQAADPNAPQQGGRRQRGGANAGGQQQRDPVAQRQAMMDRMRESFEVKDDAEWKVLEEKIVAVMDARRAAATPMGFGRGGRGGPGGAGGANPTAGNNNGGRQQGGAFGNTTPNPDFEALQKAIEEKAPADEIKAKLAKYRDSHKAAQAKLTAAQEDLKKVLTPKQEAVAVVSGLLS
ncbi:MAG: hypothetical protein JWM04_135 [Verrucomicrobiales bacterium]|nr:hypothetical protein [Verrucomicrobiales bacterium]